MELDTKVLLLLKYVKKHPILYTKFDETTENSTAFIRHKFWEQIAKNSGFERTEAAISRWHGLTLYFRQLLQDVAKQKRRRGEPHKFVKLSDWRYYEFIKFVEPYLTSAAPKTSANEIILIDDDEAPQTPQSSPSPPPLTIPLPEASTSQQALPSLSVPVAVAAREQLSTPTAPKVLNNIVKVGKFAVAIEINNRNEEANVCMQTPNGTTTKTGPVKKAVNLTTAGKFKDLSKNHQSLKSFFDAMFKSTQRLPQYHQECVKRKLLNAIRNNNLNINN